VLKIVREELRLDEAELIVRGDDGRLFGGSRPLRAALERAQARLGAREIAVERGRHGFVLCAVVPGTASVLVAAGDRDADLDEDDRAFLCSMTTILAAGFAATSQLAA
jgi:hypothetical protein